MSTVEDTVARLAEQLAQAQAQIAALSVRQAEVDPVLLAQQRRGVEAALDAPLKSMPEGARAMDFRSWPVRKREMALAKMPRVAANRGGVWHPNPQVPSVYGHRGPDPQQPWQEPCPRFGEAEFDKQCQKTCWTPETETRFLYALGLKDMADGELIPLTPKDPVNNRDAIAELVGLLRGDRDKSTLADTLGRYQTGAEQATVAQTQDARRKTASV